MLTKKMGDLDLYAEVEQKDAQRLKLELMNMGIYNKKRLCIKKEGMVKIPICKFPVMDKERNIVEDCVWKFELNGISFKIFENLSECLRTKFPQNMRLLINVKNLMESHGLWRDKLEEEIPKSWDKFGSVILFDRDKCFKSREWRIIGPELWTVVCSTMDVTTIAMKGSIRNDAFRRPYVDLVWGSEYWAVFKDNNIMYTWDVTKLMFSSGNVTERHRMGEIACKGEVIVDLFCGIGYFTVPLLVHGKANLVHACEWNPDAVEALRKNLTQNGIEGRCIIHEGDCRKVQLTNVADRVILGLLPSSECGWEKACETLKPHGGVLHIHENVLSRMKNSNVDLCDTCKKLLESSGIVIESNDNRALSIINGVIILSCKQVWYKNSTNKLWLLHILHKIEDILKRIKFECGVWEVEVLKVTHVKSYAPHINHVVFDLECRTV